MEPKLFTKLHYQAMTEEGLETFKGTLIIPSRYGWLIIGSVAISVIADIFKNRRSSNA